MAFLTPSFAGAAPIFLGTTKGKEQLPCIHERKQPLYWKSPFVFCFFLDFNF